MAFLRHLKFMMRSNSITRRSPPYNLSTWHKQPFNRCFYTARHDYSSFVSMVTDRAVKWGDSLDYLWIVTPSPKVTDIKTLIQKRKPCPVQELSDEPHSSVVTNKTRASSDTQHGCCEYTKCFRRYHFPIQCCFPHVMPTRSKASMFHTSHHGHKCRRSDVRQTHTDCSAHKITAAHAKRETSGTYDKIKLNHYLAYIIYLYFNFVQREVFCSEVNENTEIIYPCATLPARHTQEHQTTVADLHLSHTYLLCQFQLLAQPVICEKYKTSELNVNCKI